MIAIQREHRRFALWAAAVLVIALPVWWLVGADIVLWALRPLANVVFKVFGLSGGVAGAPENWSVMTGLPLANGQGDLVYPVMRDTLRRQLLGFPLLFAFLCAPPRTSRPVRAAVIGAVVLTAVFLFCVTTFVWGELAPMLNPALAPAGKPPAAALAAPPLHPAIAQTVLLGRYAGMSVLPFLTALLVWAAANPNGVGTLFTRKPTGTSD